MSDVCAVIPANVRYDANICASAKLLYGEICALRVEFGNCKENNLYFSDLYGVDKSSISRWIKQLVDSGYITSRIVYKTGTKEAIGRVLIPMTSTYNFGL